MDSVELQGQGSDRDVLRFCLLKLDTEETTFAVEIDSPDFRGRVEVSTCMVNPPSDLFEEMALNWQGWTGEKTWEDIEKRCKLSATHDGVGRVQLKVDLCDGTYTSRLLYSFFLEPGSIESFSHRLSCAFASTT